MKTLEHTIFGADEASLPKDITRHFNLVGHLVKKIDIIPNSTELGMYDIILHIPEDTDEQQIFLLGVLIGAFDFKRK